MQSAASLCFCLPISLYRRKFTQSTLSLWNKFCQFYQQNGTILAFEKILPNCSKFSAEIIHNSDVSKNWSKSGFFQKIRIFSLLDKIANLPENAYWKVFSLKLIFRSKIQTCLRKDYKFSWNLFPTENNHFFIFCALFKLIGWRKIMYRNQPSVLFNIHSKFNDLF